MFAAEVPDVDQLARSLREDGVVIDVVMGSGESQDSHDRIAALVREVPFPVYVALVKTPEEIPNDDSIEARDLLVSSLHRSLGDGLYIVATDDGWISVTSWGLDADPDVLSGTARANVELIAKEAPELAAEHSPFPLVVEAEAQVRTAEDLIATAASPRSNYPLPPVLEQRDARELAERAITLENTAGFRPERTRVEVHASSRGLSVLVGCLTAVLVALLLGQSLRGWPTRRGPVRERPKMWPPTTPDPATERAEAVRLADQLAADVAATDWTAVRAHDVANRAVTARDVVGMLLASDDVADLIGAQVVARAGMKDLQRGVAGHGAPLRVCFFDPRHPSPCSSVYWPLGEGRVKVPGCAGCVRDATEDRGPRMLCLGEPEPRPYWEREDIWARTGYGTLTDTIAADVLHARSEHR